MKKYVNLINKSVYAALLISLVACSKDNAGETDPSAIPEGYTEVKVTPERTKMIRNPFNGWVLYSGLGDGLSETFWEDYDNFQSSEGIVNVSDYASVLYIKGAWSDMNPEENVYIWQDGVNTKPAQRLRMLMEGAEERGLKLAFTFSVDSRDKHYNITPDWVKDKTNGKGGFTSTTGSTPVWSPYPDDPTFQECWTKFITAFAEKFNDPTRVEFISGLALGKWGESHTVIYSTGANNDDPKEAVVNFLSDLLINAFTKVPVVVNYHRSFASTKGEGIDPDSETLLDKLVNKGFSLRHDAFGMKHYYMDWERSYVKKWNYKRPVIMEGGWVKSSHGSSLKGDGYADYAEVRQGEFDEARGACVNMMDFRYSSDMVNGETASWFNDAFNLVNEFIAEGGYRIYPDRVILPEEVTLGDEITIRHSWTNLGWGYCPTNIPQWANRFKVTFALLDSSTGQPVALFQDDAAQPHEWIKGSQKTYTLNTKVENVAPGSYIWAVGIVDKIYENTKIGINLAAKENITDDGWLKLHEVTVK